MLAVSLAIPLTVAGLGSLVTISQIPGWYAGLEQPSIAPPNWVFGPVWTLLYSLMGLALYLVWRQPGNHREAYEAFALQLLLNLGWSYLFFGAHLLWVALLEIVVLLLAIIYTAWRFYAVDTRAAWLLLPYIAWVTFATFLNLGFALLN